ncbi:MAG: flavodoxin family protein [Sedimentisphaerales bacterium]|nr:flavodoxin family protein [Sedimentisphaerales bacterium]
MTALVIYDSFFGNTERIAQAIGEGLGGQDEIRVSRVDGLKPEQMANLALLVVGSPTRAFRPSPKISAFLRVLPTGSLKGVKVAAFDTRIDVADIKSRLLRLLVHRCGYAAKPIATKLARKGGEPVAAPEGFQVAGTKGPLKEGELDRATNWGKQLAAEVMR